MEGTPKYLSGWSRAGGTAANQAEQQIIALQQQRAGVVLPGALEAELDTAVMVGGALFNVHAPKSKLEHKDDALMAR